jgi:hypothetical protein
MIHRGFLTIPSFPYVSRPQHKFCGQLGFQTLKMRSFLHFQVHPRLHQWGSPDHVELHWLIDELRLSALRLFKPTCPLIGGQVLQHPGLPLGEELQVFSVTLLLQVLLGDESQRC